MNFTPLFSIFIIIAIGYLAKSFKILEQKHSIIFIDFVLCFAIPALIFDKVYHVNIDTALLNTIATGFASQLTGALLALILGLTLKFSKVTVVSMMMLSLFGNTLFVGMPIIQGFFGDGALNEIIFYDQLATSIPISILGPLILSFGAPARVSLFENTMKILKFPPFIALTIALIMKNFTLPNFIFAPLQMLESAVTPVALFAIGVGLNFASIASSYKGTIVVIFCKMVAPALAFIGIMKFYGIQMDETWLIGLFQACMPPMVLASAMIMKAGLDSSLAVSSVALGVVFSFVSFPALFLLFG